MKGFLWLVSVALGCSLAFGASGAVSQQSQRSACGIEQLAFSFPGPPAATQTEAVGLAVHNTGVTCRLTLPVSLTLAHRSGRPLRVAPHVSRLTLVARTFAPRARAWVTWLYGNYCGRHNSSDRPIVHIVRIADIELREFGGTPPCHDQARPASLTVLFACPAAKGPAIRSILPRPLELCPA
jgi:hypothetical protein